ncbi:DUF2786 domain-containing protein [Desulfosarcina ovata]|uniref:DUF2786 domain-containing protein n=1 Tax=Desulfosarcina ovata TaxID=83564 RepID=UPI0012D35F4D|nr:DUF2786 domain-containing protein [Desulfosarcina ovata]
MRARLKKSPGKAYLAAGQADPALQTAFERQVLRGLAAEWENARWLVPAEFRESVRRPLFGIREMPNKLGSWHAARREIALSQELVSRHRWDDVKAVLLHEMAHQVAHEGLRATAETDHGAAFQRACGWLRADPAAAANYRPLSERLRQGDPLDTRDRIVVKVRKLMALAESSNANEATAAMRKAYELIARHNLELIQKGAAQTYVSIFIGTPCLRHFREAYHLALLLQDFYFVQGVWIQAWVLDKGKMGRVLEISGTRKNVQIAEYVHGAVSRYIDSAWTDYRRQKGLNRYRKTDFAVGIIEGFKSTLHMAAQCIRTNLPSDLPVATADPALKGYVDRRYRRVRAFSRQGPGHDPRVFADGTETGKKLVIAKGITQKGCAGDLRLEFKPTAGEN